MAKESEIIAGIRARAAAFAASGVRVHIGDDAAVLEQNGATDLLACTDLSVEGVHFRLDWASPRLVGRKALAVTLSDIAAMGGRARFALVSLAVPSSALIPDNATHAATLADEVMDGLFEEAEAHGVAIVGGDTSRSPSALFIDTVALGECPRGGAVRRSGARPGEVIYVTGALGASQLGLRLLERGYRWREVVREGESDVAGKVENGVEEGTSGTQALLEALIQEALDKHLRPQPRLCFGQAIGERRLATAMIDISDGLSTDLSHLLEASHCGALLDATRLPLARAVSQLPVTELLGDSRETQPLALALHGGEEYELLFTAGEAAGEELADLAKELGIAVTVIGRVTEGRELRLQQDGKTRVLKPSGYEHAM